MSLSPENIYHPFCVRMVEVKTVSQMEDLIENLKSLIGCTVLDTSSFFRICYRAFIFTKIVHFCVSGPLPLFCCF